MQGRHADGEWDVRRFRPTVLIEADGSREFPEDAWIGSAVRVGDAEVTVVAPTVRCVMTTRAQPGLARDLGIVKTVNRDHESSLGVYAVVSRPGPVAVGDAVQPA
jgi:MOSC domain-containing protein